MHPAITCGYHNSWRYPLAIIACISALFFQSATLDSQTIYTVVLGNQDYVVGSSTLHSGLYASIDNGMTWQHLGPENLKAYSMDAVDAADGRILYIAAGNGVHKSTDYGASWKIVTDWRMTEVLDIKVHQKEPAVLLAATAFGLWKSTDAGASWYQPEGPVKNRYCYRIDVRDDDMYYLSSDSAIYRTTTMGDEWVEYRKLESPHCIINSSSGIEMIATANGLHISTSPQYPTIDESGVEQREMQKEYRVTSESQPILFSLPPAVQVYDIVVDTAQHAYYAATIDGIWYYSEATSTTWQQLGSTHPYRTIHALALLPNSSHLLVGTFGQGVFIVDPVSPDAPLHATLPGSQVWRMFVKPYAIGHEQ